MRFNYCIYICLLLTLLASFVSPGDPIPRLRARLASYYARFPKEKVYLQSDKEHYSAGETVWFSGYVTRQTKRTTENTIVYLDLFNDKGLIISRAMRPVDNGAFHGDITLPSKLGAGKYYLRGYTSWMLNFSTDLFFYREMVIDNHVPSRSEKIVPHHSDFDVQFFPESGPLVNRLTSLVVFKAADSGGLPVEVSGAVVNNRGDTVATIKTAHYGIGRFIIHCSPQTTYTAIVRSGGTIKKIPLPAIKPEGIVLHVETRHNSFTDSIFFHISRSKEHKDAYQHLLLCARKGNHVSIAKIHFDELTVNDPLDTLLSAPFPLLLNNFGTGILELSVLTEEGVPLAGRLVFLPGNQPFSAAIQSVNHNPDAGTTSFNINLPPEYKGSITVSVTGADKSVDSTRRENIHSGIYVAGETAPGLLSPAECPAGTTAETLNAMDMLMVISKPAGINLEKLLQGEDPLVKYEPERSIVLNGRAFEVTGNKKSPLRNSSIFVILKALKDSISRPVNVLTDSTGLFSLNNLYFHDTATVYLQTGLTSQGLTTNSVALEFNNAIFDSVSKKQFVIAPAVLNARLYSPDIINNAIDEPTAAGMLQNVTVTGKKKSHIDSLVSIYATGIFANPGVWAITLDLTKDEITKTMDLNVLEYLNGKVAGLVFAYDRGLPVIFWRYSNIIDGLSAIEQLKLNAPSFFLNESLLNTGNQGYDGMVQLLTGIRIADVAIIRIYNPGTLPNVPDNGPHGAIAIYLKNGREDDRATSKIVFEQHTKLGYTPVHDFQKRGAAPSPSTLYWKPGALPNPSDHNVTVSFNNYNNRRIRVIAEGVDENGNVILLDQIIQ